MLGPLLFRIYIIDLVDGSSSNLKLFADDFSLFSVASIVITMVKELNQMGCKMSLNSEPHKLAQEVILSRKTDKEHHHFLVFNNKNVSEANTQTHLGNFLITVYHSRNI